METEDNKILEEFRNRVKDLQQTDNTLRRFLVARNYNLKNAEDMLRKTVEWRKENDIDNALKWKVNKWLLDQFPFEFPGVDYENRAVIYAPMGIWPIREMIEAGYRNQLLQNLYVNLETAMYEISKTGEDCIFIIDLTGMSYWKFAHYETMQYSMLCFRIVEAYYPERLAAVYTINAPFCFHYVWPMLKPFVTGNTMKKIRVFGTDENKYMAALLEKIPPSSIPSSLQKSLKP